MNIIELINQIIPPKTKLILNDSRVIKTIYINIQTHLKRKREEIQHLGDLNPNETLYIIHWPTHNPPAGLFTLVNSCFDLILYALSQDFIPVIDFKNYQTYLHNSTDIGKINTWEYYFKQPIDNYDDLESAYQSKNVITNTTSITGYLNVSSKFLNNNTKLNKLRGQYRQYVRINETAKEYIDTQYNKIIPKNEYILGVSVRGHDYQKLRPYGHPIQPPTNVVIEDTKLKFKEWGADKIFLTTEDQTIIDLFKREFDDKLIYMDRRYVLDEEYIETEDECIGFSGFNRENDKYLTGLEYLASIVILSRCNAIIASPTSGIVGALLMSEGFDNTLIYDWGVYGVTDSENTSRYSYERNTWIKNQI